MSKLCRTVISSSSKELNPQTLCGSWSRKYFGQCFCHRTLGRVKPEQYFRSGEPCSGVQHLSELRHPAGLSPRELWNRTMLLLANSPSPSVSSAKMKALIPLLIPSCERRLIACGRSLRSITRAKASMTRFSLKSHEATIGRSSTFAPQPRQRRCPCLISRLLSSRQPGALGFRVLY